MGRPMNLPAHAGQIGESGSVAVPRDGALTRAGGFDSAILRLFVVNLVLFAVPTAPVVGAQSPALPAASPSTQTAGASYSEPAQPKPSEAVQKLLDEAEKVKDKRDYEGALKLADHALTSARESHDAAGEASAQRERAILLEQLQRVDDAMAEWKETAADWERLGDGPGGIEALAGC